MMKDELGQTKERSYRSVFLRKFIFIAFGLSGCSALIYEIVWTRNLSIIMGSTTYALSSMLAAFMTGLSIGGFLGGWITRRSTNHYRAFALCEMGIGVSAIAIIPIIRIIVPVLLKSYYAFHASFHVFSIVQFVICVLIMLVPTTLMGMTFPIIIKIHEGDDIGAKSGYLYGINTIGAVVGSISGGFFLIPLFGIQGTSIIAATINILTASIILMFSSSIRRWSLLIIGVTAMLMYFLSGLDKPLFPLSYYMANKFPSYEIAKNVYDEAKKMENSGVVYHHEGAEGSVSLLKSVHSDKFALINNGKLEAGGDLSFMLLAYLPYFSLSENKNNLTALNIGLGSGTTLSSLAGLPIETIDSVELSEGVVEANRLFLNPAVFKNPKISHITADGRHFIYLTRRLYDIIIVSPSYAVEQSSAGMLTDEFFFLASSKLSEGGIMAVWVDQYRDYDKEPGKDLGIMIRTFSKNFKHATAWVTKNDALIFIGSNSPLKDDNERIIDLISEYDATMRGNFKVVLSGREFRTWPAGEINTDDMPITEFRNARHIITGFM